MAARNALRVAPSMEVSVEHLGQYMYTKATIYETLQPPWFMG